MVTKSRSAKRVQEHCAGIVIFSDGDKRRYLILRHRNGGHWSFPKGHIEEGESDGRAALRETQEETGISDIKIVPGFRAVSRYRFSRSGTPVDKDVVYFLGRTKHQDVVLSHEHVDWRWADYETALTTLTYDDTRQVLRKAEEFLGKLGLAESQV